MHRYCVLIACVMMTVGAAPATPDPYSIYSRAREYWQSQRYPALVAYRVAVDVSEGGKERVERYESVYDGVQRAVRVNPVSDWELEHPASGRGVNIGFALPLGNIKLGKPEPPEDFLGVPLLAPAYTFGMGAIPATVDASTQSDAEIVAAVRAQFHDPNPRTQQSPSPSPSDSGLHEIATVVAYKRDYDITLVGEEPVDDHHCYHLHLRPTHDPNRLRLRDLWVDTKSSAPWKLTESLNFADGPGTAVPWTVRFDDVAGAHYIAEEDAGAPMSTQGLIYTQAAVRFEDVHAISRLDTHIPQEYLPADVLAEP